MRKDLLPIILPYRPCEVGSPSWNARVVHLFDFAKYKCDLAQGFGLDDNGNAMSGFLHKMCVTMVNAF